VQRTKEIAGHYYLSEKDMLAVFVAAWFHDTGFVESYENHERPLTGLYSKLRAACAAISIG
jgi:hypothetical protein